MAGMTDINIVNKVMQALYSSSATFTITPGTSGGSAFTITPPMHLHLFTAVGSEATTGTELTTVNGYTAGYPAGGSSMGSSAFGPPSSGVATNGNSVSWSATGVWSTVTSIEIWDSASTAVRYLWGLLTSSITGVANGDTVQFAASSVSISGSSW